MRRRMFLSVLVLACALAGPLAAFEISSIQINPAEPATDDPVVVTVAGVSETACFTFDGVQQYQQRVDFVFFSCPILPLPGATPFTWHPLRAAPGHRRVSLSLI